MLEPKEFVGEPVARTVGDDTRRGGVTAYDGALKYWHVRYYDGGTERYTASMMHEHGPARTTCAAAPSDSERAIAAFVRTRVANEADWYMQRGCGLTPYQQRQLAQLTTGSDYAVCRGKRGPAEGRLCPCGAGCVETTEHALLRCPLGADMRAAFASAQRALRDAVADAHKYELAAEEALRWAIDDMCPMHFEPGERATAALLSYRVAMLDFHRESKRARFARARDTATQRPRAL